MPSVSAPIDRSAASGATAEGRAARRSNPVTRFIRGSYGTAAPMYEARYGRQRHRRPWLNIMTVLASALAMLIAGLGFYCYNLLVRAFIDVEAARSRVAVLMQRRNDLTRNLEKAVVAERTHEAAVFAETARQRSSLRDAPKALPAPSPTPSPAGNVAALAGLPLDRLLAIAEQYPQIRLSENMQALIQAVVEVERDLGGARQKLVDTVSVYLHDIHTYPCRWFAWLFGFRDAVFFEATSEAGRLAPAQL